MNNYTFYNFKKFKRTQNQISEYSRERNKTELQNENEIGSLNKIMELESKINKLQGRLNKEQTLNQVLLVNNVDKLNLSLDFDKEFNSTTKYSSNLKRSNIFEDFELSFVHRFKQKIKSLFKIIRQKDVEIERLKFEYNSLKEENTKLKDNFSLSNKTIIENISQDNIISLSHQDVSLSNENEFNQLNTINKINSSKFNVEGSIGSLPKTKNNQFLMQSFEYSFQKPLLTFLTKLSKAKDLKELMMEFLSNIKTLLEYDKCSIIVINKDYIKSTENFSNNKLLKEKFIHNKKSVNIFALKVEEFSIPKFKSAEDLKTKKSNNILMAKPIFDPYNQDVVLAIQMEKEINKEKGNFVGFNTKDNLILNIISKTFSFKIAEFCKNADITELKKRREKFTSVISKILSERTEDGIQKSIKTLLSKYLGFDHIGILFYDNNKNELYTMHNSKDEKGFTKIKYPVYLGISSEILQTKKIYWTNLGCLDPKYNQLTDNSSNGPYAKNILAMPVFTCVGKLSGIIHFINKYDNPITINDEDELRPFQFILGPMLEIAKDMSTYINMTISLQLSIDKLIETINKSDNEIKKNIQSDYQTIYEEIRGLISLLGTELIKREKNALIFSNYSGED